jgi:hypothetical protein
MTFAGTVARAVRAVDHLAWWIEYQIAPSSSRFPARRKASLADSSLAAGVEWTNSLIESPKVTCLQNL